MQLDLVQHRDDAGLADDAVEVLGGEVRDADGMEVWADMGNSSKLQAPARVGPAKLYVADPRVYLRASVLSALNHGWDVALTAWGSCG
ncbi:hypothetical protein [Archangium violaceum]|uniref:hypothetical protein n=1 Tax=Archangium violaceum TaxID=83451 RepID=UPI0036D92398